MHKKTILAFQVFDKDPPQVQVFHQSKENSEHLGTPCAREALGSAIRITEGENQHTAVPAQRSIHDK